MLKIKADQTLFIRSVFFKHKRKSSEMSEWISKVMPHGRDFSKLLIMLRNILFNISPTFAIRCGFGFST